MAKTQDDPRAWRRRDVLRAGAGAIALLGGARAAKTQSAPRLGLPLSLFADAGTLLNARLGGHLSGRMAEAEIERVADSAAVIAGLRAGRFVVGQVLALELIRDALQPGEPLVSLATIARVPVYIYTRSRRLHDNPARFAGRRVAVPDEVAEGNSYLSLYLARNGGDPRRVQRVQAARETDAFLMLMKDEVDGAVFSPGVAGAMTHMVKERGLLYHTADRTLAPFPGLCFVATRRMAETEAPLLTGFVRGLLASAREQAAASETYSSAVVDRLRRVEAPPRGELHAFMLSATNTAPLVWVMARERDRLLRHDPARWAAAGELVAKAGLGNLGPRIGELYTNRFVEEVSRN